LIQIQSSLDTALKDSNQYSQHLLAIIYKLFFFTNGNHNTRHTCCHNSLKYVILVFRNTLIFLRLNFLESFLHRYRSWWIRWAHYFLSSFSLNIARNEIQPNNTIKYLKKYIYISDVNFNLNLQLQSLLFPREFLNWQSKN